MLEKRSSVSTNRQYGLTTAFEKFVVALLLRFLGGNKRWNMT